MSLSQRQDELLKKLDGAGLEARVLFTYPVLAARMTEVVDLADRAIAARVRFLTGQISAAMVVRMQRDGELRRSVMDSDIFIADGAGVVLASRLLGRPLPERIAGIDLMNRLMELADRKRYRVFLFGAAQEVLDRVAERFRRDYPGAVIAGQRNGYYKPDEEPGIAEEIRDSRADILFVAMTTPKKENFLARYAELMQVPVLHGVGGSFDVVAGKVKRAPMWMQKTAMEWVYRIIQEPRRMLRRGAVSNAFFVALVAWELAADRLKPE
jgi:N-acetylglucosaminyldiphosphoundecaprenol N-acetyl-beta-D-mannosaminyltransferase